MSYASESNLVSLDLKLKKLSNPEKAKQMQRFFKTRKGEYAEGNIFIGVSVPNLRKIAAECKEKFLLDDLQEILNSKIHEKKSVALFVLVETYKKSDETGKEEIFEFYLKNTKNITNWDLVDVSSPKIIGNYLLNKDRKILYKLAKSKDLWERRIAIISTFEFIKSNQFEDTLKLSKILLNDRHDLIHKAVGWMLREVGKRDLKAEEKFLKQHYKQMPRTMFRYAIEKFNKEKKQKYLKIKIL
ncbi:MAG: DNA alkylation repair protein [Euryarchaeota archaeon HGW-Euryarchaeota-1]|nr:MAG: DNA alkylation repair protein [Euryarchaeota archaeon HGW-Euryarchaeota-1]